MGRERVGMWRLKLRLRGVSLRDLRIPVGLAVSVLLDGNRLVSQCQTMQRRIGESE